MSSSWIEDLISEHQVVETPVSFIYWSLMFVISSAAANQYTLRTLSGRVTYHPNLYIMLLADSGIGKGYPINLAKRILQEADITRVIAGRSSIQAIIKEGATTRSVAGKAVITDSRMAIINGELSAAIIGDPQALEILTDLFDRNYQEKGWVNLLKGDGAEKLKDPYVSCLFGSSPAHFYNVIPQHNIEGGYVARNLIVYEEKRARNLDLLDGKEESLGDDWFTSCVIPKFVPHIIKIATNKARLVTDDNARNLFNVWRRDWREKQLKLNDKTGFANRLPDHVIKVAMCLCLARYDNNSIITEEDIVQSIEKVSALTYANQKATEGTGLDVLAAQTKKVVNHLISAKDNQLLRRELLILGYGDFSPDILDKIIDSLLEMRWVSRQKVGVGKNSDYLYNLAGEPKSNLANFRQKK